MGFFSRKEKLDEGLAKTRKGFFAGILDMMNAGSIDDSFYDDLEDQLILADAGADEAGRLVTALRQRVRHEHIKNAAEALEALKSIIVEELRADGPMDLSGRPAVIMVIGVNGVGKTTTIGKLAARFRGEGKRVVLGAADTFRAAAIEQLEVWADRAGADLIKHAEGSDPAAVVFDTLAAAKARGADVVICDTAGRLHNKKNLMDELAKISRVIDRELPGADKEVLLVLDATTGQNAVNQAREFKNAAGITGIVLTKLDGTARGGVVLAIREDLQVPVKFVGVGEGVDDLLPFDPDAFARGLFEEPEQEK